jgi:hypothetical protein
VANVYRLHYGDASILSRMEVVGVDQLADHQTA